VSRYFLITIYSVGKTNITLGVMVNSGPMSFQTMVMQKSFEGTFGIVKYVRVNMVAKPWYKFNFVIYCNILISVNITYL